jgi:excisionase family DNA binding protein
MEKLLDIEGAAATLGISPRTLRRLVSQELIAHRRIGRRILFTPEDVSEYVASCLVHVGSTREPTVRTPTLKWLTMPPRAGKS